jgi:transketolase
MRTAFINQLIEEARINSNIFLIVGDLGFSVVEPFAIEFPERFLNIGIAEQNMAGFAVGLAMEGYIPFIYSIGNFPTLRCMEQIRYDICYHNANVKIVAVGGGYSYGSLGASHHATEELGMLRTIPNLVVTAPGDPIETRLVTKMSIDTQGPFYIRLGKAGEPIVHKHEILNYLKGDAIELIKGTSMAILSTGSMLKYSQDYIIENNFDCGLYSFPIIKPLNKSAIISLCNSYKEFITIEEHQMSGGFGSAFIEVVNDIYFHAEITTYPKIKRIAIPDQFCSVAGSQQYLWRENGLIIN